MTFQLKSLHSIIAPLLAAGLLPVGPLSAASVEEITSEHYGAMLKDLDAYIQENPEADDLPAAYENAIQAAFSTGDTDKVVTLLGRQFDLLSEQKPLPVQELAQTGMMRAQFAMRNGNSGVVKEVHEDFKALAETRDDPIFQQVLGMLKGMTAKPAIGSEPELEGTTLEGEEISLDDYRGKVVMIDFWATWCGPCIAELPTVKAAYEKYHDKGFEIIGVSLDRSRETLVTFIEKENIAWPNIFDPGQEASLADQFGVTSIPSVFLVDQKGEIAALDPRGPQLEQELAKLLEKE